MLKFFHNFLVIFNFFFSLSSDIQIFAVKPVAEPPVTADQHSTLLFGAPEPPILDYYASNSVRQFLQDRPVQRAPFDPLNEFKSLWIERTVYATERPLPGVMRMFAVVATSVHYLAPVENACETIENMNVELGRLIARFSSEATRPESVSPLSMRLQVRGNLLEKALFTFALTFRSFISSPPGHPRGGRQRRHRQVH